MLYRCYFLIIIELFYMKKNGKHLTTVLSRVSLGNGYYGLMMIPAITYKGKVFARVPVGPVRSQMFANVKI